MNTVISIRSGQISSDLRLINSIIVDVSWLDRGISTWFINGMMGNIVHTLVCHLNISIFDCVCMDFLQENTLMFPARLNFLHFVAPTVQSVQRPAAAVRGSAPPGSPRRVAPLRLQQESLQREKEEAQQKERERQAEERKKDEQREEVSCWRGRNAAPLGSSTFTLSFLIIPFFSRRLGSEAAGLLRAAAEAAVRAQRGAEKDNLGFGSLHHHHSALLPQGSPAGG